MTSLESLAGTVFLGTPAWGWVLFLAIVLFLLVFDLGVLHRDNREIGVRQSLWLSSGYIGIALLFGIGVYAWKGSASAVEYYTGFLLEKSLSLDNVFVISLIFGYFAIPRAYQHRVLFWGILGVIVMRAILIGAGTALVTNFHWILYIFGAFLLITGVKMLLSADTEPKIGDNPLLKILRRRMRVTEDLHRQHFFVRLPDPASGRLRLYATPLFLALVLIEFADLIFAVDSVPAVLAITQDPFIVYTSNIFAILGLRALYFALAAMVHRFSYLKYALSAILIFIGAKIFYNEIFGKMDPVISLSVTLGLLVLGVLASMVRERMVGAEPDREVRTDPDALSRDEGKG